MTSMWDERYGRDGYAFGKEPNDFLRASSAQIPMGKVLCLADGEGRNGVYLAGLDYRVTSVDQSAVALAKAERLAAECGVTIETIAAGLADFVIAENSWEGIVSIFCHVPPSIRTALYAKVVRGLKKGGVFVLESYRPAQLEYGTGGPPVAELMVTAAELKVELAGLDLVHCAELDREVVEGAFHTGMAAVVQVIGIKR